MEKSAKSRLIWAPVEIWLLNSLCPGGIPVSAPRWAVRFLKCDFPSVNLLAFYVSLKECEASKVKGFCTVCACTATSPCCPGGMQQRHTARAGAWKMLLGTEAWYRSSISEMSLNTFWRNTTKKATWEWVWLWETTRIVSGKDGMPGFCLRPHVQAIRTAELLTSRLCYNCIFVLRKQHVQIPINTFLLNHIFFNIAVQWRA